MILTKSKLKKFTDNWYNYLIQSLLATVAIFIILFVLNLQHLVNVASLGASTFIVFALPKDVTAQTQNIIGGHTIGLIVGIIVSLFILNIGDLNSIILISLAVGISMFLMVVLDFEHPPAAGTALGVAYEGISQEVIIAVVVGSIILGIIHKVFKSRMKNLV